ncbi:hypothetical protein CONPUDRAFT_61977, partial [Coniophora puteana RWD-64-598 SS2]
RYTTFSHRWGDDEPAYSAKSTLKGKGTGYKKLVQFLNKTLERGIMFAWTDTCCIDKSSSAELDEAIRSMFRWYQNSTLCIVHLANTDQVESIHTEEWFRRGWTLQELLAPPRVKFFNKNWTPICPTGDDKRPNEKSHFGMFPHILETPVAEKMAWAANRITTRGEDMAYSLMGILNVSMQTAYGEGRDRAFRRLFQAIVEETDDSSVLCFDSVCWPHSPADYKLKDSTAEFPPRDGDGYPYQRHLLSSMTVALGRIRIKALILELDCDEDEGPEVRCPVLNNAVVEVPKNLDKPSHMPMTALNLGVITYYPVKERSRIALPAITTLYFVRSPCPRTLPFLDLTGDTRPILTVNF